MPRGWRLVGADSERLVVAAVAVAVAVAAAPAAEPALAPAPATLGQALAAKLVAVSLVVASVNRADCKKPCNRWLRDTAKCAAAVGVNRVGTSSR